jgi:hypothetical protein
VKHDVLKLKISMDNQDVHHVVETVDKLVHDLLNDGWADVPLFDFHNVLEVTTIAIFHEDVVP